jgi:YgiT-type zinc finger domain-containing protein
MKCSIQGCPGEYEETMIIHVVAQGDEIYVFDHVPAEVCSVCGDTLLKPETIRELEKRMKEKQQPARFAPVYEFA